MEGEVKEILGSCRKLQVTQNLLPIVRILKPQTPVILVLILYLARSLRFSYSTSWSLEKQMTQRVNMRILETPLQGTRVSFGLLHQSFVSQLEQISHPNVPQNSETTRNSANRPSWLPFLNLFGDVSWAVLRNLWEERLHNSAYKRKTLGPRQIRTDLPRGLFHTQC